MYNTEYKKPRNMKEGKNRECVNESFPVSQYQDLPYEIVILHHRQKSQNQKVLKSRTLCGEYYIILFGMKVTYK